MPYRLSAVIQASGAAGTTVRSTPFRDLAAVLALEQLGIERLWPGSEAGDRHHLLFVGEVDHDWCHTGDIDEIALQDTECDPGGTAGIDGVPTGLQDVETGRGGEIVARRDRMLRHGDGRPMR